MSRQTVTLDPNAPQIQCRECERWKPRGDYYKKRPTLCRDCRLTPERRARQKLQDQKPRVRFSRARSTAKKRGYTWTLNHEQYEALIALPCHYCQTTLEPAGIALDRGDNERGYEPDNVVPCCCLCNTTKAGVFNKPEMELIGAVVAKIRTDRIRNGDPRPVSARWQALTLKKHGYGK